VKRQSLLILNVSLGLGILATVGVSAYGPKIEASKNLRSNDAAFRDGMYQAKIDVQDGKSPHLRSGRWSSHADRALFIAGYEQAYREYSEAQPGKWTELSAAELAGYSAGTLDGASDRLKGQPFQAGKTANYQTAGQGFLEARTNPEEYMRSYRQAYSRGYQHGYYFQEH
jgi:hypothetical protein